MAQLRCLVIGGAGFIGSVLCSRLQRSGIDVTILDKRPARALTSQYVEADIRDFQSIQPWFRGQDVVINLAAEHQDDVQPLSLYTDVNITGAENICAAATSAGVPRIIFTSSVAIYGSSRVPLREDAPAHFFNEYGRTKYEAERVYRRWKADDPSRHLTIIRPTVVFGPGNRGNVFNLLKQIKLGPFVMIGDGSNVKSIAHVENVAGFIHHLVNLNPTNLTVNYSDGPDLSVAQLVRYCHEVLGRAPPKGGIPKAAGFAAGFCADLAARILKRRFPISAVRVKKFCASSIVDAEAAYATGYKPSMDLRAGLREMLEEHV